MNIDIIIDMYYIKYLIKIYTIYIVYTIYIIYTVKNEIISYF